MQKRFYTEFETWREGQFTVPWNFRILEETNHYRSRHDLEVGISPSRIAAIFLNQDATACTRFLQEYVNGVVIGAIIPAQSIDEIGPEVGTFFGPVEIFGICELNQDNAEILEKHIATKS